MENEISRSVKVTVHDGDAKFELTSVNDFEALYFLEKYARLHFKTKENIITVISFLAFVALAVTGFVIPAFFAYMVFNFNFVKILKGKNDVKRYCKTFPDREYSYSFYDNYLIIKTPVSAVCLPYDEVSGFRDSEFYLIIHLSNKSNYIIRKSRFDFEFDELKEFLKDKVRERYT